MVMKNSLMDIIEDNLEIYFPDKKFSIKRMKRIKTKIGSEVLNFKLISTDKEEKEIYIKKIDPLFNENVLELLKLKKYWEYLLIPKMIDFLENENSIVYEGVKGSTLSSNIIYYLLKPNKFINEKRLLTCASKIGNAIGHLQKLTKKGESNIGDLNIFLINQFESSEYVNNLVDYEFRNKIQCLIEKIKNLKISVAQFHGDPTPHNILMHKDEVHLLDFSFQDSVVLLDPLLFSVSLDLMRNRMPYLLNSTFKNMKKNFFKAYEKVTYEHWEKPVWDLLKLLTYFHILIKYKKRKKNLKNYFVTLLDERYLLKEIRNFEFLK